MGGFGSSLSEKYGRSFPWRSWPFSTTLLADTKFTISSGKSSGGFSVIFHALRTPARSSIKTRQA